MKIAVLGGRLQGVEIAYLAAKAGWQVVGVDRDATVPAAGLCDAFHTFDLMDSEQLVTVLRQVDFVVPALEDKEVLDHIADCAERVGVRIAYDREAYLLSSSKLRSDGFFALLGVPAPKPWPFCGFPLTVKPSDESGSKDVRYIHNACQYEQWLAGVAQPEKWVKQEYLSGPSYSIEVVGAAGQYQTFQITELEMDAGFDCKRVTAPVHLPDALASALSDTALTLAGALQLNGIMDVEVILHQGQLKVLEIDARFPSQTPTAVYHASGVNLVEVLWQDGDPYRQTGAVQTAIEGKGGGVIYEHILVEDGCLSVCGEHIMAHAGPLSLCQDFFGAQEALTNYRPGRSNWVATLIMQGKDLHEARIFRDTVMNNIRQSCNITCYSDPIPSLAPKQRERSPVVAG
jgi:pyrrolysine biosynthesis protein PylC